MSSSLSCCCSSCGPAFTAGNITTKISTTSKAAASSGTSATSSGCCFTRSSTCFDENQYLDLDRARPAVSVEFFDQRNRSRRDRGDHHPRRGRSESSLGGLAIHG